MALEVKKASKIAARKLAVLINIAGEGIPEYLWADMAVGNQSPIDVGEQRAARDEGSFSYCNARVCEDGAELLGMIISYQQPNPYVLDDLGEYPEVVHPLLKLEVMAPGSWYINAIATFAEHRGKGVASRLLQEAEEQARRAGCAEMSLIVASENHNAKALYEHLGYKGVASLPVMPWPDGLYGGEWVLMIKGLSGVA